MAVFSFTSGPLTLRPTFPFSSLSSICRLGFVSLTVTLDHMHAYE